MTTEIQYKGKMLTENNFGIIMIRRIAHYHP